MKRKFISAVLLLNVLGISAWAQDTAKDNQAKKDSNNVISRNIHIEPSDKSKSVDDITKQVVESTYKNFPQQAGQPTIIINNIILPSDYNRQGGVMNAGGKNEKGQYRNDRDERSANRSDNDDNFEYRSAPRQRGMTYRDNESGEWRRDYSKESFGGNSFSDQNKNLDSYRDAFQDRDDDQNNNKIFDKKRRRNSGTWLIPMVGIHASGFDANVKDDKYEGRTGWNAGLDIRMRAKRFFVQPGLHYFNSAIDVTSKDSVSTDNFTDGPRIHAVKLPVMLGIYLTKANSGFFKLNVKAGGSATYLIDVDKSDVAQFNKRNLHDFTYGVNAGLGFEFGPVVLDLSHEWGVSSFFKNTDKKNNIARITLGVKF